MTHFREEIIQDRNLERKVKIEFPEFFFVKYQNFVFQYTIFDFLTRNFCNT